MLSTPTLTGRRELVEQLDSEPLFAYLIQNGVIDNKLVEDIRQEKSQVRSNLTLLQHLEGHGKNAVNLFINALRQTGQHSLASLLDEGTRIKARSNSGYLGKSRRKGQVSLEIRVSALRLSEEIGDKGWKQVPSTEESSNSKAGDWVSLEDIEFQIAQSVSPTPERASMRESTPVQALDIQECIEEETETKRPSCFCACFAKIFSRKKSKPDKKQVRQVINRNNSMRSSMQSNLRIEYTNGGHSRPGSRQNSIRISRTVQGKPELVRMNSLNMSGRLKRPVIANNTLDIDLENLKNLADFLQQKCETIYGIWQDRTSAVYTQLMKYFEQEREVLVLETHCQESLVVVSICMKLEQLEELSRDCGSGRLTTDLESYLINDQVLKQADVSGIRLTVSLNNEDYESAEQELS